MKDQVLQSRDDQRAREYAAQIHRLRDELIANDPKPKWRRRAVVGVIIGSVAYILTSCYLEQELHKSKIERAGFRVGLARN